LTYRPIRKSAFVSYIKCQKKFEYLYSDPNYFNYGLDEGELDDALRRGNMFHSGCDKFFSDLEGKIKSESITQLFRTYLPTVDDIRDAEIVNNWFDWFAETEKQRYIELDEANKIGYFLPIAKELEIKLPDTIDRTGHVDRVDMMPDTKELCIVEYKTGKSYDMDNSYSFTDMNKEIGFYVQILNATNVFPNYKITHWKVVNPTLKKIWINKISPISLRGVEVLYKEITDKVITKGKFNRNLTPLCKYCPYVTPCMEEYYQQEAKDDPFEI